MKLTDKQTKILNVFGYESPLDFLTHYPFRYDFLFEKPVNSWEKGDQVIFKCELVSSFSTFRFGCNQSRTNFKVIVENELVSITLFNMPFLKASHYESGMVVIGTVNENKQIIAKRISNKPIDTLSGIQPIYSTKTGIKQHEIKRLMAKIFKHVKIDNVVPETYVSRYKLLNRDVALKNIHNPTSSEALKQALRTLKYEEFLLYHLVNAMNASDLSQGIKKEIDTRSLKRKLQTLPYELTADQISALDDITKDLSSSKQMHRLLQGDVGSGKTVVALLSAFMLIKQGYQVAFMVPTEILLEQHLNTAQSLFPETRTETLSSSTSKKSAIYQKLENHEIDLVIGTHALFQDDVKFKDLGLVIIDEQHRFGVEQRRRLIKKGDHVDTLMLSATPIPRSLAASLFFDLDISSIQTYPSFRKENKTVLIEENSIRSIIDELQERLNASDQMYVVCPSIDEDERQGVRNVVDIYQQFKQLFKNNKVAMLHSRIDALEKEHIMHDFSKGEIDILISTTIIEVGIDVHNANTMVIYNAELFGLSTLHQLRGRIGRGQVAGVCYLLSSHDSKESQLRLKTLTESSDGFKLSMLDLKMRGMGDILGDRQSGLPHFILGDIEKDQAILTQAKIDAMDILDHPKQYKDIINIAKAIKMMYN